MQDFNPIPILAAELNIPRESVAAVIKLLKEGNTTPFIARYRKEATGNLDEVQIRTIDERYQYLVELEERRDAILKSIESQGKLTPELKNKILSTETKNALEDLYLPFKPKRRTRGMIAKEKGLEPLALLILEQSLESSPTDEAAKYINEELGVADIDTALKGARDIVAEVVADSADARGLIREAFSREGVVVSRLVKEKESEAAKYKDYFEFQERVTTIPSHRYLAIRRGDREGFLDVHIEILEDSCLSEIQALMKHNKRSSFAEQLQLAIADGVKRLILPSVETDVKVDLKMVSDRDAVEIFAQNLRNLLLSSPLGSQSVIGVDPGLRTGCKCAAVDSTGKFLETMTFYITGSEGMMEHSKKDFVNFVKRHRPHAIAVGNGTGGRETEGCIKKMLLAEGISDIIVVQVSESGASIYSASDVAREEFPDLDLTIRGAISIGRRLQDPLAELVKVDPKSIGVGQYQHDVYQPLLQQKLEHVVESCVNFVGVDLNTASAELLSYVAGIGASMAKKIVSVRDKNGLFRNRRQVLEVPGLGDKTFQQAAGFLRIRDGEHPLDASAVHPEQYSVVEKIAKDLEVPIQELIGNMAQVKRIDVKKYIDSEVGEYTLKDIVAELMKPGRDPRASFEMPAFRDDVMDMKDLKEGMILEGIVTNVTAFGAFVDVGVHQDGLIHISHLSETYVKNPSDVVQVGEKIKVKVLEVDIARKRISLSARLGASVKPPAAKGKPAVAPKAKASFDANPFASL